MKKYTSRIKWFSNVKGYGFLEPVDGIAGDIIVHHSEVQRRSADERILLYEGDRLSFAVEMHAKGPRAVAVTRV